LRRTEGEVVAAHALDGALADHEAAGHAVHQDVEGIIVDEVAGATSSIPIVFVV
jgi:hypothetical protein